MNFTENLKLTQFGENDITSWLGNYNTDMEKIDRFAGTMANTTTLANAKIATLESEVSDLKEESLKNAADILENATNIGLNKTNIELVNEREQEHYDALSGQIDALTDHSGNVDDSILVLQTNQKTIRDMTAVNTSSINKLQMRVETLEEKVANDDTRFTETLEQHGTDIAKLKNDVIDADATARQANTTADAALQTAEDSNALVTQLNTRVEDAETDIDGLDTSVKNNSEQLQNLSGTISQTNAEVASLKEKTDNTNTNVSSLEARVETLEDDGTSAALTQRVEALETWEGTAKTQITTAQTTADQASTVANNVQSQVSGIKSGVAVPFSLGVDSAGNYGYIKDGADTVTPFLKRLIVDYNEPVGIYSTTSPDLNVISYDFDFFTIVLSHTAIQKFMVPNGNQYDIVDAVWMGTADKNQYFTPLIQKNIETSIFKALEYEWSNCYLCPNETNAISYPLKTFTGVEELFLPGIFLSGGSSRSDRVIDNIYIF